VLSLHLADSHGVLTQSLAGADVAIMKLMEIGLGLLPGRWASAMSLYRHAAQLGPLGGPRMYEQGEMR
jgi:hypothetical protein